MADSVVRGYLRICGEGAEKNKECETGWGMGFGALTLARQAIATLLSRAHARARASVPSCTRESHARLLWLSMPRVQPDRSRGSN